MTYTRINIRSARNRFARNRGFVIVARNLRPEFGISITAESYNSLKGQTFEQLVNSYEYYNCNAETGRHAAFYFISE